MTVWVSATQDGKHIFAEEPWSRPLGRRARHWVEVDKKTGNVTRHSSSIEPGDPIFARLVREARKHTAI